MVSDGVLMRALVTGGAGFLGSHHCEKLLSNGWDVACFDNKATGRSGMCSTSRTMGAWSLFVRMSAPDCPAAAPSTKTI
ncbi:MAG: NAD-dependent epimerase/dehydratase family protein [Terriglobales bacterium]